MRQMQKKVQLIGILNCTPDSFFEKSRHLDVEKAVQYGLQLFKEGADMVDIGGESTNPNTTFSISEEEEISRVIPVIKELRKKTALPISIDTYKPRVAEKAMEAGATFLNDITGFSHPTMRKLAKESRCPICVMHAQVPPYQKASFSYPKGVVNEILSFFQERVDQLLAEGIEASQIILDPGIGGGCFGKDPQQSLEIINNIPNFCALGFPILIALSRKSFIQKILSKPASEILSTTIALNTMSVALGVSYIRVHDVKEHREVLGVLEKMQDGS